jgi:hypothetical protein
VDAECKLFFKAVKNLLEKVTYINISADLASQKGLSHSFLAVTAHFFNSDSCRFEQCLLDVAEIKGSHTHSAIKQLTDAVLTRYDISTTSVFRYVIDNGSNIVKAFKEITG